ncbi:MAG: type 1 glutamine amidotransferase [Thermomicrobiales bacterium]|jgi:protease I|nr:type 1 glutamine amidotransferase [Thermomicrobiales bacterium]
MSRQKRVAVVIAKNFEDIEATDPIRVIEEAGAEAVLIGIERGPVEGKKGAVLEATLTFDEIDATAEASFDALVIPGGGAPENLRIHQPAVDFTARFVASGKPVASICHGPQLLISAKVLNGRTTTCVNKIRDDVVNAGANYVDEPLVVDGNLISSRTPADMAVFNQAIVDAIS